MSPDGNLGAADAAPAAAPANSAEVRWADAARVLFILAAIGSVSSPPLANIAAALGLIAFFCSPRAWPRLCAAANRPLGRGILVLLATLALAMLWAEGAAWGRRFAAWWSWRPLILLLVGSVLFEDLEWKDRFARALVAVLALAALGSFVLRLLPDPVLLDDPGILLRNHTTQGMAFVVGTALAGLLACRPAVSSRMRWGLIAAMALFVVNIATITAGRSAHIALLVMVVASAFALLRGRHRWQALVLIPVLGVALLAASPLVRNRFATAYGEMATVDSAPVATSSGIRIVIWSTTRELIARHPWFGYGVGGFVPAYDQLIHDPEHVVDSGNWRDASRAKDTHNQYLHLLVEAGILGLLAFLAFVAGALRQRAPPPYRGFGLALLSAWLATSLFNSHFQTFAEAHLIGLVLGVLLAGTAAPYGAGPRAAGASAAATSAATSS